MTRRWPPQKGADVEGWVRLGLPQDFAEIWLPDVLGRFARQHPGVRIEAGVKWKCDILERLRAGGLDLALAWGDPEDGSPERLLDLPIEWIGPAKRSSVWTPSEPPPLVLFDAPCRFRVLGLAALDRAGIPWRLAFASSGLAGIWAAVAAGLGVSLRTSAGLPRGVRPPSAREIGLPHLPRVSLSLCLAEADPGAPVAMLAATLHESLIDSRPHLGQATRPPALMTSDGL